MSALIHRWSRPHVFICLTLAFAAQAQSQSVWNTTTGDWSTAANWSPAVVLTSGGATTLAATTVRVLPGVRILDVQVDLDPIANANVPAEQAPGPDSPALKGGVPTTYQIAVTPDEARLLAFAAAGGGDLYLTVTSTATGS